MDAKFECSCEVHGEQLPHHAASILLSILDWQIEAATHAKWEQVAFRALGDLERIWRAGILAPAIKHQVPVLIQKTGPLFGNPDITNAEINVGLWVDDQTVTSVTVAVGKPCAVSGS